MTTPRNPESAPADNASIGVIAVVPDRWRDVATSRHHVLSRLAQRFPVVWLEPSVHWRELLDRRSEASEPARTTPTNLHVMSPRWHDADIYRAPWLTRFALARRLRAVRRQLLAQNARRIVIYLWRDAFAPVLDLVAHDASLYHVDDEYTFSTVEQATPSREAALLARVDQVIVHSAALLAKKGSHNVRTAHVPNGVDYAAFAQPTAEPADLASVPRPRLGYAGVIKRQLDFDLLMALVTTRPQWSLVLTGPLLALGDKGEAFARLVQHPNVYLLGEKPLSVLPAYMQHVDVNLMCYEVNDYTRYIHPLKLNEYLAAGRPVVSSPIAAAAAVTHVVSIARDVAQWLGAVEAALRSEANSPKAIQARRHEARLHDWTVLVERIGDLIERAAERTPASDLRLDGPPAGALSAMDPSSAGSAG